MSASPHMLTKVNIAQNQLIFKQGDPSHDIFLIQGGTVELFEIDDSNQQKRLKVLGAGYAFGEQALVSSDARTYCARAVDNVTCVSINTEKLLQQVDKEDSFIAALFRILLNNMSSVDKMGRSDAKQELENLTNALSSGGQTDG